MRFGLQLPWRAATRLLPATVAALCALTLTATGAQAADSWPSDTAGGANTSYNAGEVVLTPAGAGRAQLAWSARSSAGSFTAPTVVNGKVFRVDSTSSASTTSPFEVRSARTGALLWSIPLPDLAFYEQGVTVDAAKGLAVVSFKGSGRPDGVLAVDLIRQRIAWRQYLPADRHWFAWDPRGASPAVSDGSRVYVSGADNAVNAFRLSDGARLWTVPLPLRAETTLHTHYGTAVAGGLLYVGTSQGLRVHDAVTGRRVWTAAAAGYPVVAGSRVFVARAGGVTAVSASGCGAGTCPALWHRELGPSETWAPGWLPTAPKIGGASSTSLFATYHDDPGGDGLDERGVLVRLSAATGAVVWSASTLEDPGFPARGGDTVWLIASPGPNGEGVRSLVAYPASGRGTDPVFRYEMPFGDRGFQGGVAVSGGSAVVQQWAASMRGFRIPGT